MEGILEGHGYQKLSDLQADFVMIWLMLGFAYAQPNLQLLQ